MDPNLEKTALVTYVLAWCWQLPWMHGLLAQSSRCERHMVSWKPSGQMQVNEFTPSTQVPPLRHGFSTQSSMLTLHVAPDIDKKTSKRIQISRNTFSLHIYFILFIPQKLNKCIINCLINTLRHCQVWNITLYKVMYFLTLQMSSLKKMLYDSLTH